MTADLVTNGSSTTRPTSASRNKAKVRARPQSLDQNPRKEKDLIRHRRREQAEKKWKLTAKESYVLMTGGINSKNGLYEMNALEKLEGHSTAKMVGAKTKT